MKGWEQKHVPGKEVFSMIFRLVPEEKWNKNHRKNTVSLFACVVTSLSRLVNTLLSFQ
jgi:hypothetical protein